MLLEADPLVWAPMAVNQYQNADNMTDRYAAREHERLTGRRLFA